MGDVLKPLTLNVPSGQSLLIMGPSGVGKSSLLRVLGGLWTPSGGHITMASKPFYVPQRPYVSVGTLRENVCYPMTSDSSEEVISDAEIAEILRKVGLERQVDIAGDVNTVHDWPNTMSGGECQRLGFARVLFHRPKVLLLDESTSALDVDMEMQCMELVRGDGITVVSVGHRPTLRDLHDITLSLSDDGSWAVS